MNNIWTPEMVFENIEHKEAVKYTMKPNKIMIIPRTDFTFQIEKHDDYRNIRLFKGSENTISYQQQYTVNWVCDYNMRWYPFDTQVCTMEMLNLESSVTLQPISVKYLGPPGLTQYTIKRTELYSGVIMNSSSIIVEVIFDRPLFGTTLTVFMPTSILLFLSKMVRVFGKDHLEMVIEVNLTLLLVLATL